jgi:hypothetical protein
MNIPGPSDWTSQLAPLDRITFLNRVMAFHEAATKSGACVARGGGAACQASTALGGERWRSGNGFGGRNWAIDVV